MTLLQVLSDETQWLTCKTVSFEEEEEKENDDDEEEEKENDDDEEEEEEEEESKFGELSCKDR